MTNATHTPGPWTAEYSDYGDEIWFGGYDAGMWTIEPLGAYLDGASQANARLIAAAPDLLAALELIAPILADEAENRASAGSDMSDYQNEVLDALDRVEAAIAKAKGE